MKKLGKKIRGLDWEAFKFFIVDNRTSYLKFIDYIGLYDEIIEPISEFLEETDEITKE